MAQAMVCLRGVYTRSLDKAHWIGARLVAGQVYVNEWFADGIETRLAGFVSMISGARRVRRPLVITFAPKNLGVRIVDMRDR